MSLECFDPQDDFLDERIIWKVFTQAGHQILLIGESWKQGLENAKWLNLFLGID